MLDLKLSELRPTGQFAAPPSGWIKALREALVMSQADLGRRMGISQSAVAAIERSEASRRIQLDTLSRVADALDCDVVYALVPRAGLESTLRSQALRKLAPHLAAVTQTMSLEDQQSSPDDVSMREEIDRLIETRQVWR